MRSISLHPITDPAALADWDAVAGATGASPFVRSGWIRSWARSFGEDVRLAVLGSEGFAPVIANGREHLVTPVNGETPEYELVAADESARSDLRRALLGRSSSIFEMFKISPEEALAIASEASGRVTSERMQRSPYLQISDTWEEYERSLGSSFRQGIRRKARRLGDEGEVAIERYDGASELGRLLDEGFAVESSQWKAQQGTAIASRPETLAFYREVAKWAAEKGWLRLWFLRLNGRALAFRLDLEVDGVYFHVKGGYEPDLARYSPGLLLQHESVKGAFGSGARRYEFLGADEPYKLNWTKTCRDRMAVRVYGRGPRATGAWALRAFLRPAVRKVRSLADRAGG